MTDQGVFHAAHEFNAFIASMDRQLRRTGATVPSPEAREVVADAFWTLFDAVDAYEREYEGRDLAEVKRKLREIVSPWLCRSPYFWRSLFKPHGYPGDYRMIEWMYDLEDGAGEDPTQPAIVNCLNYTFSTIHSVVSLWERRRWFATLFRDEFAKNPDLSILDIACGGARYVRDFLISESSAGSVKITLVDQDPSALSYARCYSLAEWKSQVTTISAPIKHLATHTPEGPFDVIISSGLFDYLNGEVASAMINHLLLLTKPGGIVAISNFHPDDKSASCKDWGADWQLIFRDEDELAGIFPKGVTVSTDRSTNHALAYAYVRKDSK